MKLPDILSGILPKKEDQKDYFFSLYLDADAAAVSVWSLDAEGKPHTASFAHAVVAHDTWEARIQVVDRLLSAAEDKVGVLKAISKTVFGIPGGYLTNDGEIHAEIRPHLKKLSRLLELEPVGFVPLSQAVAFDLKKKEGVPPSVILVGCSKSSAHLTLFRVGQVTHEESFDISEDAAATLEAVLKKHQDSEVLPSRILLYGGNAATLDDVRAKLLKHPWPTRANFLHFPKIETISVENLLTAVSLAGASELAHDIGEGEEAGPTATVVAQPTSMSTDRDADEASDETMDDSAEDDGMKADELAGESDDAGEEADEGEMLDDDEPPVREAAIVEPVSVGKSDSDTPDEDVANVEIVTPESLGFRSTDVLEEGEPEKKPSSEAAEMRRKPAAAHLPNVQLPAISFAGFKSIPAFFSRLPKPRFSKPKGMMVPLAVGGIALVVLGILLYRNVPKATVTVLVASQTVEESAALSVDPAASVADPEDKIVPGQTRDQSVSGEKTITVTGKKNIGDPAKGTVTVYNKVAGARTLSKGAVLSSGGIEFTLDADVSVASASESIGSITFGKANAAVTAREIGANGNLPAGAEFSFSGVSSSQVSARNESAFTGGSSKQVTVVSRADQDALVKAITDDLVIRAKEQLQASTGGEHLIDQTIKTEVTEKTFSAELDQEVKELHGSITVKVSGVSFLDSDVKAALLPIVEAQVPSGYSMASEQTRITTSNVTVKKDGTITMSATLTTVALPVIDEEALRKTLAGKDVTSALEILKQTKGVGGAEFNFTLSPTKSRLPYNGNNITISVMVQ